MRQDFSADNTLDSIIGLMGKALEFLRTQNLSTRSLFIAELALEEMLTNTVKYAYDDEAPHSIGVRAEVNDGRVVLEIHDDGHFFDPCAVAPPPSAVPLAQRGQGGRGIHLVRKLVQEFEYRRAENQNIVRLGFPATAPAPFTNG